MDVTERLKKEAAELAVKLVRPGMVLGLGSGSTAMYAIELIARFYGEGKLKGILGIASSLKTEHEARRLGIPLTTFEEHPDIDLNIDGADEVDPNLDLIKGGGGALLREKILAQSSRRTVIIVDESKLSPRLGTIWPVPVEVLPFALGSETAFLKAMGAKVRMRKAEDGSPFRTDQGNLILDCDFGPMEDPEHIATSMCKRAGIVEHGLFIGLATDVIVVCEKRSRHLKRGE